LSNEEKTNDYENFEKGMIYMKILTKKKIVQLDIYYDFQSFFNEHEYKYAVDVMRNSIHVCFEE
jgi:hypothetical protein